MGFETKPWIRNNGRRLWMLRGPTQYKGKEEGQIEFEKEKKKWD
jgi:hypothetical protein